MRPLCIYSVFTTEAFFDPVEFTITQHPIIPFTPRCPRSLPFQQGVCWCLTFEEIPLLTEEDSEDKEDLPTVDLNDLVWSKEPVPDSWEYLCMHEIPRKASHPTSHPHSPYQQPCSCSLIKEYLSPSRNASGLWTDGPGHLRRYAGLFRHLKRVDV